MPQRFEYEVWMIQDDRVTFVNGRWRGPGNPAKLRGEDIPHALQSCPLMWDLLNEKGREGWRLTSVISIESEGTMGAKAFLERSCEV